MRMFTIPNQSSVPKAYTLFTDEDNEGVSRLMEGGNRERVVDCVEEFVKYTIVMRGHFGLFGDRYSERIERDKKAAKLAAASAASAAEVNGDVVNGVDVGKI
jgi:arsenic resistance protein ArsH